MPTAIAEPWRFSHAARLIALVKSHMAAKSLISKGQRVLQEMQ
jgi:hypothetical protein